MSPIAPLRIFVDAHLFDQEYQGSRTCLKQIYTRLASKPDLQLFLGAYDTENLRTEFRDHPSMQFLSYSSNSRWKRLLIDIPALILKNNIDLAHYQYIPPLVNRCSTLVTIHDILYEEYPEQFSFSYRFSKKLLFSHGVRRADQLITVSEHSAKAIQTKWPPFRKKLQVIPNGVDDHFFQQYEKSETIDQVRNRFGFENYILFVSRWEPRKGHLELLRSWLQLKLFEQNIQLVFIGHKRSGLPLFERMVSGLTEMQKKLVHIREGISEEDLRIIYQAARLFVYPSYAEGFGLPPLEAGATGIPVVCSNSSAMREFDFFAGGWFDPNEKTGLTDTIKKLIDDPPDRGTLEAIRSKIKQQYSWDKAANQHYELIKKMKGKRA